MKRKYFISSIIVLIIMALGICKIYHFSTQDSNPEKAASSKSAADGRKITSVGDNPAILSETNQNFISYSESDVNAHNELTDQMPTENALVCDDNCVDKSIQILNDHARDNASRKDSARILIRSGNKEAVLSVLKAIIDARFQEDYDLIDSVTPIFATVHSIKTAGILIDVLTGKANLSSALVGMPEDVTYAIKNAIRLMPNEAVGEMLAQKYRDATSEEEKTKLFDIKHPVMIARLATDAFQQRDIESEGRLIGELCRSEDNTAIMGMMVLAREKTINLENATNMLTSWNFTKPDKPPAHFMLVGYLGNAEFSPEERSLAAYAMTLEKDKEMAISALKKAQLFEEDPFVKKNIEDALSRITG